MCLDTHQTTTTGGVHQLASHRTNRDPEATRAGRSATRHGPRRHWRATSMISLEG